MLLLLVQCRQSQEEHERMSSHQKQEDDEIKKTLELSKQEAKALHHDRSKLEQVKINYTHSVHLAYTFVYTYYVKYMHSFKIWINSHISIGDVVIQNCVKNIGI